ncbi:MAG: hypothetical protein JSU83_18410 [Deltaproteobacteria bacterium]|nr:MAG: hypothetical protein JSU83_18410 [Deltaproteobacteria bacterium]
MKINKFAIPAFVFLVFIFQGCATLNMRQYEAVSERPENYKRFFKYLDKAINKAGVQDASTFPVPGFPYLRTDRFLAGMRDRIDTEAQKELWLRWMRRHDDVAREKEINNLPDSVLKDLALQLGETPDRNTLMEKVKFYSEASLIHDRGQPDFYDALKAAQEVPDEYSMTLRTFGLYPLWSLPVANATDNVYDEFRQWHNTPLAELKIEGKLTAYAPLHNVNLSGQDILTMFHPSNRNALGLPQLSNTEIEKLVNSFAPVISQDIVADYDKIGQIFWNDRHVSITPRKPTVYYYITYALFKGEPVLQLNYAFWYSGRDGPNPPWIERGSLDGITVRITFDPEGQPFMADIMNNCGCYYFLIPRKERVKRIIPQPMAIDPFVPAWLPQSFPEKRLKLRVNSGWHQVQKVDTGEMPSGALSYALIPYDSLEMLPHSDGRTESIFDATGVAKDSTRIEPLIFFPSGIHDIGSMRQRGHHAIKLVGRAHFDDPQLFDESFEFN